ncbi:hypothetical protein V9T40_004631 [Parthenolecanium corni]|uniref:Uncharacterized protein n=1 Tax=Parthenolecanium corni TaxID=536013 RepID=A0AAN9Y3F9_9HEMI
MIICKNVRVRAESTFWPNKLRAAETEVARCDARRRGRKRFIATIAQPGLIIVKYIADCRLLTDNGQRTTDNGQRTIAFVQAQGDKTRQDGTGRDRTGHGRGVPIIAAAVVGHNLLRLTAA